MNTGKSAARDVEVFARAVLSENSDGTWVKNERFLPQWLCWSTLRNLDDPRLKILAPTIPQRSGRYFDFAHVIEPAGRALLIGEDDPKVPSGDAILSLDGAVSYQRLGHLLPPGHYAILLEVSGTNVESREFIVLVNNPGKWDGAEEYMLSRGVKVERAVLATDWEATDNPVRF